LAEGVKKVKVVCIPLWGHIYEESNMISHEITQCYLPADPEERAITPARQAFHLPAPEG